MENVKLIIGLIFLCVSLVIGFIYWQVEKKILMKEMDPIGFKGIPFAIALVGLPFLSAYFIAGVDNLIMFAIYGFGFSLVILAGSFLISSLWNFISEPVIISKPKEGGKSKNLVYTIIQLALMGVVLYLIWISYKMIFQK